MKPMIVFSHHPRSYYILVLATCSKHSAVQAAPVVEANYQHGVCTAMEETWKGVSNPSSIPNIQFSVP